MQTAGIVFLNDKLQLLRLLGICLAHRFRGLLEVTFSPIFFE